MWKSILGRGETGARAGRYEGARGIEKYRGQLLFYPGIQSPFCFPSGTHNFSVLSVGGLGGADLSPAQELISIAQPLHFLSVISSEWQTSPGLLLEPWPGLGREVIIPAGIAERRM